MGRRKLWRGARPSSPFLVSVLTLFMFFCTGSLYALDPVSGVHRRLVAGMAYGFSKGIKKLAFEKYEGQVAAVQEATYDAENSYLLTPHDKNYYSVKFYENLTLPSADGTKLSANLLMPVIAGHGDKADAKKLPAIVFISSWILDKHEYLQRAITFAERGYIVLAYSTRGFAMSEGMVTVGGPDDMQDISSMIDWLESNTPLAKGKVGLTGISYGALLSLLGAAHEPRVSCIAALSGASSITDSLFWQDTPSSFWSGFLIGVGEGLGRFDPQVKHHFLDLLHGDKTPEAVAWAEERSPIAKVDQINRNGTKIYIAHGWLDYLFKPETMFALYDKLDVPKKLTMHDGIHFLTEMLGAGDPKDAGWNEIHEWFDYWLVGDNTVWHDENPIHIKVRHDSNHREHWSEWEPKNSRSLTYYMSAKRYGGGPYYKLTPEPSSQLGSTQIHSGISASATTGVPLVSSILDAYFDYQIKKDFSAIDPRHALMQVSEPIGHQVRVRGAAKLDLQFAASSDQVQVVAYLYDVDGATNIGTLITHGVVTRWQQIIGEETKVTIPMVSTAYDMQAGHRLGLVIDTFDPLYVVPIQEPYRLRFSFGPQNLSKVSVPYILPEGA